MIDNTSNSEKVHFKNLDVLRFFAAFFIVLSHGYFANIGWQGLPIPLRKNPNDAQAIRENLNSLGVWLDQMAYNLDIGVEFFFLISGFLITYLMIVEINRNGKLSIFKFYMRRIFRIWPLYFLILLITPLIVQWTAAPKPDYWWSILFVNNYKTIISNAYEPGLAHLWSICVEEHFYLVWPVLVSLFSIKNLPRLFMTIIFVSLASRAFYFHTSSEWFNHVKLNTICRMDTLAIGGWLAWISVFNPMKINVSGWIRLMIYAIFIFILCVEPNHETNSMFSVLFKRLIYTAFLSFLLMNYLFNPNAWLNFKEKNVLHYLGKISFGIYMYHNIFFGVIIHKIVWPYGLQGFWLFWIIYISITIGISIISYELFEKHFLKLKNRFTVVFSNR